ncbi:MAG: D-alanine--D-alanine ligase [Leptonema sp. (in: Bacteria)]|nr:D-alanine--D-alanine ligase [Leptonema sp. (in: bacteria)]
MSKKRVAICFGGKSSEHDISIISASFIYDSLDRDQYEPLAIYIDHYGRFFLLVPSPNQLPTKRSEFKQLAKKALMFRPGETYPIYTNDGHPLEIDVLFPILHGPNGEDGTIQGLLRLLNIAFVGCDVLGSALSMDKAMMKPVLSANQISTARYILVEPHTRASIDFNKVFEKLGSTVFVKPSRQGSSVGVSRCTSIKLELLPALDLAFQYDTKVLIEEAIVGREIECAVLGNSQPAASIPGEIRTPKDSFYSYDAKYVDADGAVLQIPAKLTEQETEKIQVTALQTYRALDCEGLARVDVFLKEDGAVIVNEVNTMPGFTNISMYPKMWQESGVSPISLISQLIELAISRHELQNSLKTNRTQI